jgi:4'-phosphopantetheinyl transferase
MAFIEASAQRTHTADVGPLRAVVIIGGRFVGAPEALFGRIGPGQRARFEGLRGADAERFLVGRALVADLVEGLTPGDVGLETQCPTCGASDHGMLRATSGAVAVSVSYAVDAVAVAVASSTAARSVGIDIEQSRPGPMTDLARLFAPAPPPTIDEWTAIEAVVKADGRGLRIDPAGVELTAAAGTALPGGRIARLPGGRSLEVSRTSAPAGYTLSVAIDPAGGSPP